jgi:HEPN domain-containing protein
MATERVIASLLRVSSEDLAGARLLAAGNNRNAIYLLSQAAEKIIKAVLVSEGVHGGVGHNLDLLVDKIPDENLIKPFLRGIERLGDFSTTFRYPTSAGRVKTSPSPQELDVWAAKVEAALERAASSFVVDLSADGPARRAGPIR